MFVEAYPSFCDILQCDKVLEFEIAPDLEFSIFLFLCRVNIEDSLWHLSDWCIYQLAPFWF